jgi:hypothetical protein
MSRMAVLLNQASNLRVRVELLRRLSDGTRSAAALEMAVAVERYRQSDHSYEALLSVPRATLLDMDLIQFLQALEELLDGRGKGDPPSAALEASVEPAIGLRLVGGPEAYLVELGVDLLNVLETVGGMTSERGSDLVLYRFAANQRAALAFSAGLLAEFEKFPTDPGKVHPGEPS